MDATRKWNGVQMVQDGFFSAFLVLVVGSWDPILCWDPSIPLSLFLRVFQCLKYSLYTFCLIALLFVCIHLKRTCDMFSPAFFEINVIEDIFSIFLLKTNSLSLSSWR